ncbi:MAG TPA: helix-turn-helix domain-containing protein [Caulobacterales bacterium]|nr:helix-turn-helix domain-containing protein [Caulobacterales bacterium]
MLDTAGAARFLGVSPQTLEKWRCYRPEDGPAFMKIGRVVRYRRSDLLDFMAARVVGGTR